MALLATSCTMRNKPSLLLDKGPEYLRTRTNGQMFEHRRKSAVELLAASRPQYVKSAAVLDSPAGLTAGTPDRHFRSICQPRERPAPRSKSEFDISKLHELLTEDEADSNCAPGERSGRRGSVEWRPLSAEGEKSVAARSSPDSATAAAAPPPPPPPLPPPRGDAVVGAGGINRAPDRQDETQRFFLSAGTANTAVSAASTPAGPPPPASSPPPLPPLPAATAPPQPSAAHSSAEPAIYTARPIYINLSHSPVSQAGSTTAARNTPGSSAGGGSSSSSTPVARGITVLSGGRHLPSPSGHLHHHHHQHLSSPPESRQPPLLLTPAAMSEESSDKTPTNPTGGEMGPPPLSSSSTTTTSSSSSSPSLPQAEPLVDTERSRGVAVVTSSPSAAVAAAAGAGVVPAAATTTTTTTTTSASSSSSPGPGPGPRVSMRSSGEYVTTVSGLGSGGGVSQVPRSFSDIACHHSRAGSDVSSEASRASRTSRASRASAGANLEKFFNEMGMERDILDPLLQLQQQQQQQQLRQGRGYVGGSEQDLYESLSSLDSHDARSICSALSRSEKEISTDAESYERSQHQTSIVERNARIIKWLCSVKKAKTPAAGLHQGSAAS